MIERLQFIYNRLTERLWIRPLLICIVSIIAVFLTKIADYSEVSQLLPELPSISLESIETLLNIISSSMLVIATFAVASMVSAYASASTNATPRAVSLVIADDVSQNALSTFIGAFIFSIVALTAVKNSYYGDTGLFALFSLTVLVFVLVIIIFVRWVDSVARLGRLGATIDKVEKAALSALQSRKKNPGFGCVVQVPDSNNAIPLYSDTIGYIQRIDAALLQSLAKKAGLRIAVSALPGTFAAPGRSLAYIHSDNDSDSNFDARELLKAFIIGRDRKFDNDPRFALVVLSEIAVRALSPAINDPGTAIDIIGRLLRLIHFWAAPIDDESSIKYDLVTVPPLTLDEMFDDAFSAIARDGAGLVEVGIRLQKAFQSFASTENADLPGVARNHSEQALSRAKKKLTLQSDLDILRSLSGTATE